MTILTEEFVFSAIKAEGQGNLFPIDFEEAWQTAGYTRKDNAKRALVQELIENEDYFIDSSVLRDLSTTGFSSATEKAKASKKENIKLSSDGFDHFCMMAKTAKGREARKLFIQYKKAYLANLKRLLNTPQIDPRIEKYEKLLQQINPTIFEKNLKAAWQVSGIRQYSHIIKMLKESYQEGADYRVEYGEYVLSNPTYNSIIAACRSTDGVDVEKLSNPLLLDLDNYAKLSKKLRNGWLPKRRGINLSLQLSLFND